VRFRYFPTNCQPNFILPFPQLEVINSTVLGEVPSKGSKTQRNCPKKKEMKIFYGTEEVQKL
jgi:hypothetical protein